MRVVDAFKHIGGGRITGLAARMRVLRRAAFQKNAMDLEVLVAADCLTADVQVYFLRFLFFARPVTLQTGEGQAAVWTTALRAHLAWLDKTEGYQYTLC